MKRIVIRFEEARYRELMNHLQAPLPDESNHEQAAFAFASISPDREAQSFDVFEHHVVEKSEFAYQSNFHIEISDTLRARIIKRAHDLSCSLIEFHSHVGPWPAQFSLSDLEGLAEFVPHVWWRLKGRPYAAVVVAASGFDSLAWIDDATKPQPVAAIEVSGRLYRPTDLSWHELQSGRRWTA